MFQHHIVQKADANNSAYNLLQDHKWPTKAWGWGDMHLTFPESRVETDQEGSWSPDFIKGYGIMSLADFSWVTDAHL